MIFDTINMVVKLLVTVMVFKGYPSTDYLLQGRVILFIFWGVGGKYLPQDYNPNF